MCENQDLLMDTCLIAGRIMVESGSEAYRVEDTMERIAQSAGEEGSVSYVTATGVFMNLKEARLCQLDQVKTRSIDLEKVDAVNRLSREFAEKSISLEELYKQLFVIDTETLTFPFWLRILCAGFVSSTLMIVMGGTWENFIATFFIGMVSYIISFYGTNKLYVNYLSDLAASFFVGTLAFLAVKLGVGTSMDNMIIGGIMPLVPGLAITSSFRDILAGHLLSGISRGVEAIFTVSSIGMGIAVALKLFTIGG